MVNAPWIHASTAQHLLECPKRWMESATASSAQKSPPTTVFGGTPSFDGARTLGTLVHQAVETWINTGKWKDASSSTRVADEFRAAAAQSRAPIGKTRLLAADLAFQLDALRALLDPQITEAVAEQDIDDPNNRIRGRIDILCRSPFGPTIVDIKTGRTSGDDGVLLNEITTQLTVYCWLLHRDGDPWPTTVIVGPKTGVREVKLTPEAIEDRIAQLLAARDAALANPVAIPGPQTCRYCTLRPVCRPHWGAVRQGAIADATEGTIIKVEQSSAGTRIIAFDNQGEDSRLKISPTTTIEGSLAAGDWLQAIRVAKDPDRPRWTAGDGALITSRPRTGIDLLS